LQRRASAHEEIVATPLIDAVHVGIRVTTRGNKCVYESTSGASEEVPVLPGCSSRPEALVAAGAAQRGVACRGVRRVMPSTLPTRVALRLSLRCDASVAVPGRVCRCGVVQVVCGSVKVDVAAGFTLSFCPHGVPCRVEVSPALPILVQTKMPSYLAVDIVAYSV